MSISHDVVVNARLIRFEYGSIAEISSSTTFPTPYYLALVFSRASSDTCLGMKGQQEMKEVFPVSIQNAKPFDLEYLKYVGKIVKKTESDDIKVTYYFLGGEVSQGSTTDETWISIG